MATITYTVTVATGTNAFSAGANKFFINGTVSPVLELQEGNTYIFDQSEGTNATFILALSSTKDGTNTSGGVAYTTGVTTTGVPGKCWSKNNYCCRSCSSCWRSNFILLLCGFSWHGKSS